MLYYSVFILDTENVFNFNVLLK